jgi:hypothetical protein
MKKTTVKEEVLKMRFEEIYGRFQKKKLKNYSGAWALKNQL